MLNAKYVIVENKQNRQRQIQKNPRAYGNAWFVGHSMGEFCERENKVSNRFIKTVIINQEFEEGVRK